MASEKMVETLSVEPKDRRSLNHRRKTGVLNGFEEVKFLNVDINDHRRSS